MDDVIQRRTARLRALVSRSTEAEIMALLEGLNAAMTVAMIDRNTPAAQIARLRDAVLADASRLIASGTPGVTLEGAIQ